MFINYFQARSYNNNMSMGDTLYLGVYGGRGCLVGREGTKMCTRPSYWSFQRRGSGLQMGARHAKYNLIHSSPLPMYVIWGLYEYNTPESFSPLCSIPFSHRSWSMDLPSTYLTYYTYPDLFHQCKNRELACHCIAGQQVTSSVTWLLAVCGTAPSCPLSSTSGATCILTL